MISPKKIKSPILQTPQSNTEISSPLKSDKNGSYGYNNYKYYIIIGVFVVLGIVIYYLYKKLRDTERKLDNIDSMIDKKINTLDQTIQTQQQIMTQKLNVFEAMTAQQKLFINTKIDELTSTVQNHINFIRSQSMQVRQAYSQPPQSPQNFPQSPPPSVESQRSGLSQSQQSPELNIHNNKSVNNDFDLTDLLIQPTTIVLDIMNSGRQPQKSSVIIEEDDEHRESSEIDSDLDKELINELNELKQLENDEIGDSNNNVNNVNNVNEKINKDKE